MNAWKRLLMFSPFLAGAILLIVWFYVLNVGEAQIMAEQEGYSVTVNEKIEQCPEKTCRIKLKTGVRKLTLQKPGYHPAVKIVNIQRGKITELPVHLIKVAQLTPVEKAPEKTVKKPTIWLDPQDNRVKFEKNGASRIIASLINIQGPIQFFWSQDETGVIAQNKKEIYVMNVEKGSRKKIGLPEVPYYIQWIPKKNEALYENADRELMAVDLESGNVQALGINVNLSQAVWIDNERFVYQEIQESETRINTFDVSSQTVETLVKTPSKIEEVVSSGGAAFFRETGTEKWFRLEL